MENISKCIRQLVDYAVSRHLIEEVDRAYATNLLLDKLGLSAYEDAPAEERPLEEILSDINDYAVEAGLIAENTVAHRDLFDTAVMTLLTPPPREVISRFYALYREDPQAATDYFYDLSRDVDYIRTYRVAKDLKWTSESDYGTLDITVNLSKPEKDPKAIAAAKLLPQSGYPKCLLCHENEGYAGNLRHPARGNLRQIPFKMGGSDWYLQYSPYVYYNEHCIALSGEHTPMKIDRTSFVKLLDFVDTFPHYFIGSNADLPIVGGSILAHDHMQGGRYTFPMARAPYERSLSFAGFEDIEAGIVRWPMSVIRLRGKDKARMVELADRILVAWRGYTDPDAFVYAETDGEPHNTITPIARVRDGLFELDLVLRNNITTEEHPLGVYHPHATHHNIKKENIGLIEVMGLAVLPSRLKGELDRMEKAILRGEDFAADPAIAKHAAWFAAFADRYTFTAENTMSILRDEVGKTFARVLEDAGVYKCTEEGRAAFLRFTATVR